MNQIIFIHGWETFDDKEQYHDFLRDKKYDPYKVKESRWRDSLEEKIWNNFEYFFPAMPAKQNADYEAWKIWFEKVLPYIHNDKLVLIWHSLGGIFLAKYLSENMFSKKIDQLHLVAPVFDDSGMIWEWVWSFELWEQELFSNISNMTEKIFLYHSRDDFVVPYDHSEKYLEYLPDADLISFEDRGHFLQAEFPELIENIKNNI